MERPVIMRSSLGTPVNRSRAGQPAWQESNSMEPEARAYIVPRPGCGDMPCQSILKPSGQEHGKAIHRHLRGRFAMTCVDDFTRFKFDGFLRTKSGDTEALRPIINDDIVIEDFRIDIVRTDGGGEFGGQFKTFVSELYSIDRIRIFFKAIPSATNHGEMDT